VARIVQIAMGDGPGGMATRTTLGRILVIDDEDLIRWSLRQGLQDEGYSVTTLPTAANALDQAESADLVLLDWRLPGADGLAVAKELKRTRPSRPVILMTAYSTPELLGQASSLGLERVLLKPFDLEEVIPLVRAVLRPALAGRVKR